VSSEGEGFFQLAAAQLCQGSAAAKRFCLINDLEARFSVLLAVPAAWLARQWLPRLRQEGRRTQGQERTADIQRLFQNVASNGSPKKKKTCFNI